MPPRFTAVVSRTQRELSELFHPQYPQALIYGDLCPMNILVSPSTGRVTGIIDWAKADVLPFGLALYGLDNLLGYMGPRGWSYSRSGTKRFWKYFWNCIADAKGLSEDRMRNAVTIARLVGARAVWIRMREWYCRETSHRERGRLLLMNSCSLLKGIPWMLSWKIGHLVRRIRRSNEF